MSDKRTLFVVGAGASSEVGLPTGVDLKRDIAKLLDIELTSTLRRKSGDELIYKALEELGNVHAHGPEAYYLGDLQLLLESAHLIRDGMPQADLPPFLGPQSTRVQPW